MQWTDTKGAATFGAIPVRIEPMAQRFDAEGACAGRWIAIGVEAEDQIDRLDSGPIERDV